FSVLEVSLLATTWWNRLLKTKSRPLTRGRPAQPAHRLTLETLEARELLAVQFTASPFLTTPRNRPDTLLRLSSGTVQPLVSVSPRDPGNVAASSQPTMRVSTRDGGSHTDGSDFSLTTTFPGSPVGDTATTYDSTGRLFWAVVNQAKGIGITQIDPKDGT